MNVNKKLGRLRQWGKEKMGGEVKTAPSDEFKQLEQEMDLRHKGMDKLHDSMNGYMKSLSRKGDGTDSKEKKTAIAALGSTMARHGEEFEDGSKFGECLLSFGNTHERLARTQDTYVSAATASWLEALERSLAQMKEYQAARKKLESRRLALDTSYAKMQKSKKEDFRAEEELRSQRAKFEESQDDVYRRMQDIVDGEGENITELHTFLEAEISYHDRCREALLQLRRNWPAGEEAAVPPMPRRDSKPRSRSSTLNRTTTASTIDEEPPMPTRTSSRVPSTTVTPSRELNGFDFTAPPRLPGHSSRPQTPETHSPRPLYGRAATMGDGAVRLPQLQPPQLHSARPRGASGASTLSSYDAYADSGEERSSSPEKYWDGDGRSASPATSYGGSNALSRTASWTNLPSSNTPTAHVPSVAAMGGAATPLAGLGLPTPVSTPTSSPALSKKGPPPPPPPSRATKPPPPPPPMKRSALSTGVVPRAL